MFRKNAIDLLHEAGTGGAGSSARLHESDEIVEVQIVGPVIGEGIKRHDELPSIAAGHTSFEVFALLVAYST